MKEYNRDIDNYFTANKLVNKAGFDSRTLFPLYFSESLKPAVENQVPKRDVNSDIAYRITKRTGLAFTESDEEFNENISPVCYIQSSEIREEFKMPVPRSRFSFVDILDYIYGVLHSSAYTGNNREMLKMEGIKIPYPENGGQFWELAETGSEIRKIHMLKSPNLQDISTSYPRQGNNIITKMLTAESPGFILFDKENALGRIWINDQQYFDNVPLKVWEFSIGGYQPARQWLWDRKASTLSPEDIVYYRKMIAALNETQRLIG